MSTWKLSRFFADDGRTVGVFSFAATGHHPQKFAQVFKVDSENDGVNRRSLERLGEVLEAFRPDVVINQMPYEHSVGELLSRSKDYLLLGCLRNTLFAVKSNIEQYARSVLPPVLIPPFRSPLGRYFLRQMHRKRHRDDLHNILATYDYFVMFGPPNLDELRYFVPDFNENRVVLIPNSVPQVLSTVPEKEKRIVWLGRLTNQQKRADLILPLWQKICDLLPDWHLDIVGDGPARASLESSIKESGIRRVTIHGRQQPDEYFRRASVFVMTSAWEGFPNTLVEAQSFGAVPVLFDSFPIASWIVESQVNGVLIQPFDVDSMADQIVSVAGSDRLGGMMKSALDNALRFHIDRVGQSWLSLFDESSSSGRAAG